MKYPTIRIEGAILASDILENIEKAEGVVGQKPADFNLDGSEKVKDEIARAWADAQSYWSIFKRKKELLENNERQMGTTETRNLWMTPFLGLLGYRVGYSRAEEIMGKSYAISHRDQNLGGFPIHIMSFKDSLDVKRKDGGPRISPHALVQEYLNLTEHLYALVTNGLQLRLLRDSSRLIKLSYLEFDLERMMDEDHYADFALLFRLLHYTRMPIKQDATAESFIENYHISSLLSGSRIRSGLSDAVKKSIENFSNGFLQHERNISLRAWLEAGNTGEKEKEFFKWQLRLIYRLLFLMVIEERDLIYPKDEDKKKKSIYYDYYSIFRLRRLSEKNYLADIKYTDYWQSVQNTFKLFENEKFGEPLDIKPLAGDLFGHDAIGQLNECVLDNKVVLECFKNLSLFKNKTTSQIMRINYASLNVEEFGSVYEGLLEYTPKIEFKHSKYCFELIDSGEERSKTGSHYTPDELVQPLIKHSLDYIIQEKLKEQDKEKALLSITVCDVACGSGHILLNAARRIATEVAIVRTGEEQPTPTALRTAIRDVIRNCIYGVDLNPLAIELCKVALWLEAHNPSEPLNFLDHHIKCGDAIVGLAHFNELENGISSEAFKSMPDDENEVALAFKRKNDLEKRSTQLKTYDLNAVDINLKNLFKDFKEFNNLPENSPEQIKDKAEAYHKLTAERKWSRLKQLSDIQIAQFFIPKTRTNKDFLTTQAQFRNYLNTGIQINENEVINNLAQEKRFFHWFLEFPQVFETGGFDCILGNPPYLGDRKIKSNYGDNFLNWIRTKYTKGNTIDLVGYFFLRIGEIVKLSGFLSLIATNTISQGKTREYSLNVLLNNGLVINHAIKSIPWSGLAAVEVSLISLFKGQWKGQRILNRKIVSFISSYLDDEELILSPNILKGNIDKSFQGNILVGTGFLVEEQLAKNLIERESKNNEVLFPFLNGYELTHHPTQKPTMWVINFFDCDVTKAEEYPEVFNIIKEKVKPERQRWKTDKNGKELVGKYALRNPLPTKWWQHCEKRPLLYKKIKEKERIFVIVRISKHFIVATVPNYYVYSDKCIVITEDRFSFYAQLTCALFEAWTWKYTSTIRSSGLIFTPGNIFETYPFLNNLPNDLCDELERFGCKLNDLKNEITNKNNIGLLNLYNYYHDKFLSNDLDNNNLLNMVISLRSMQQQIDRYILKLYGWSDINLDHGFYEIDYMSENDNIRYTISPEARKEILKRLLKLNHKRYHEELEQGSHGKSKTVKKEFKNKINKVEEPKPEYGQSKLFEEPNLFNQGASSDSIKIGSQILLEPFGKEPKWFTIGRFVKDAQRLSEDSAMAKKLIGRKIGDTINFGSGFKILDVK